VGATSAVLEPPGKTSTEASAPCRVSSAPVPVQGSTRNFHCTRRALQLEHCHHSIISATSPATTTHKHLTPPCSTRWRSDLKEPFCLPNGCVATVWGRRGLHVDAGSGQATLVRTSDEMRHPLQTVSNLMTWGCLLSASLPISASEPVPGAWDGIMTAVTNN
jgi:hypothetical protein